MILSCVGLPLLYRRFSHNSSIFFELLRDFFRDYFR